MTMPVHSSSYEQVYHVLFENLAQATRPEFRIPAGSEKKAVYMRLRYYNYVRVLEKEARKASEHKNPEIASAGMAKLEKIAQSRKYMAKLDGDCVVFSDRDLADSVIVDDLLAALQTANPQFNQLPQTRDTAEDMFEQMLTGRGALSADLPRDIPKNPMDD